MANLQKCVACGTTIDVRECGRMGHTMFLCQKDINAIAIASTLNVETVPSLNTKKDRDFVAGAFHGATLVQRADFLKENLGLCQEFVDIGKGLLQQSL